MSKTVVNVEETIGKTVGRRRAPEDSMRVEDSTAAGAAAWHQALPALMPRRGTVQRFRSFEEADAWQTTQQIEAKRRLKS